MRVRTHNADADLLETVWEITDSSIFADTHWYHGRVEVFDYNIVFEVIEKYKNASTDLKFFSRILIFKILTLFLLSYYHQVVHETRPEGFVALDNINVLLSKLDCTTLPIEAQISTKGPDTTTTVEPSGQ